MRPGTILVITLSSALGGCSAYSVSVDYDPRADFSNLRTWAWFREASGTAHPDRPAEPWSPLAIQRAKAAIEAGLAAKGYTLTPPEQANMLVSVHFGLERHFDYYYSYPPVQVGWGWGYRWGPYWDGYWGPPAYYPYTYLESLLIVDILESKPARRLIWRGVARGPSDQGYTPEDREVLIRQEVQEVLAQFPPGGKL